MPNIVAKSHKMLNNASKTQEMPLKSLKTLWKGKNMKKLQIVKNAIIIEIRPFIIKKENYK